MYLAVIPVSSDVMFRYVHFIRSFGLEVFLDAECVTSILSFLLHRYTPMTETMQSLKNIRLSLPNIPLSRVKDLGFLMRNPSNRRQPRHFKVNISSCLKNISLLLFR